MIIGFKMNTVNFPYSETVMREHTVISLSIFDTITTIMTLFGANTVKMVIFGGNIVNIWCEKDNTDSI